MRPLVAIGCIFIMKSSNTKFKKFEKNKELIKILLLLIQMKFYYLLFLVILSQNDLVDWTSSAQAGRNKTLPVIFTHNKTKQNLLTLLPENRQLEEHSNALFQLSIQLPKNSTRTLPR